MSFKKIISCFYIGLPICIIARVLQIVLAIESKTGFYISEYKNIGNLMLFSIFAVCAIISITAFKAYKTPEHPPKTNILLSFSAAGVVIALIYQLLNEKLSHTGSPWQILIVKVMTIVCIIYFFGVVLQGVFGIKIPAILHIIPCIYFVVKTVFTFISISSLALISDNILLMAGYCSLLLFFINYGKLYNNLDTELNFRKILSTGLIASVICNSQAIAYFAVNLFSSERYLHTDISVMFILLLFGVFTTVFTISHFYKTA